MTSIEPGHGKAEEELVNEDRKVKIFLKLTGFPSNSGAFFFRTVSSVTGYKGKLK